MKTKFKLLAILCVLILAPAGQALANGYLLLSAGSSKDDVLGESATGIKIGAGTMINENLGAEIAFVDLGTIDLFGVEISQYGMAASVMPVYKVSEDASVFARVGLYSWTFEVPFGEDTGTDPFFGFGFEYKAGATTAVVAEYEAYEVSGGDVDLISVGVRIKF